MPHEMERGLDSSHGLAFISLVLFVKVSLC